MAFNLRFLNGETGFFVRGLEGNDRLGRSLTPLGDMNGDGLGDIALGARGTVFAITGFDGPFPDRVFLDAAGPDIPRSVTGAGSSIAGIGDVTKDGRADIVIGQPFAGGATIVYGVDSFTDADVGLIEVQSVTEENGRGQLIRGLDPADTEHLVVAALGDIDDDGFIDFAVTAPEADARLGEEKKGTLESRSGAGETYVIFGEKKGYKKPIDLDDLKKKDGFAIFGSDSDAEIGHAVSAAGDVDGDDHDDYLVSGGIGDTVATLIYGYKKGFKGGLDLGAPEGRTVEIRMDGGALPDAVTLATAGDVNGDGRDDFLIGLPDAGDGGLVALIYGTSEAAQRGALPEILDLDTLSGDDGLIFAGAAGDFLGTAITGAGDLNGDGFADFAMSAPGRNQVAVVFGSADGLPEGTIGQTFDPFILGPGVVLDLTIPETDIGFGTVLSSAGDINSDRLDELMISAPGADTLFGNDLGETFILFGSAALGNANNAPTPQDDALTISSLSFASNVLEDNGNGRDGDPDLDDIFVSRLNGIDFDGIARDSINDDGVIVTLRADGAVGVRAPADFELGETSTGTFTYTIEDERGGRTTATVDVQVRQAVLPMEVLGSDERTMTRSVTPGEGLGQIVRNVGDVNNDGRADFALASPDTGRVTVVYGRSDGFAGSFDISVPNGGTEFAIETPDGFLDVGADVNGVGDINNDGIDDFAVVAAGEGEQGRVYVIFGSQSGFPALFDPTTLDGTNGFILESEDDANSAGFNVDTAGDFNNDGIDDLIIGMPELGGGLVRTNGLATIIYGSEDPFPDVPLALEDPEGFGSRLTGSVFTENLGTRVAGIEDFNGDGISDVALLADGNSFSNNDIFVVFGREDPDDSIRVSDISDTDGFVINEDLGGGRRTISYAGDLNDDGFADLAIGLPEFDLDGENVGLVAIVFGQDGQPGEAGQPLQLYAAEEAEVAFFGGAPAGAFTGWSVAPAGDVNGDLADDLLIGAIGLEEGAVDTVGDDAGGVYVVFGRNDGFDLATDIAELNGLNGYLISSDTAGAFAGFGLDGGADYNGDGLPDILIGSPGVDGALPGGEDAENAGRFDLVYGRESKRLSPIVPDISVETDSKTAIEIDLLDDATEFNINDTVRVLSVNGEGNQGIFSLNDGRNFSYDPGVLDDVLGVGESVEEVFTFTAIDSFGETDTATLTIRVEVDPVVAPILPPDPFTGLFFIGTSNKDKAKASEGSDFINLFEGPDTVVGRRGRDYIYTGEGDDKIDPGKDSDIVFSGSGDDKIDAREGDNFIFSDDGDDKVKTGDGDDFVVGGSGDDDLRDTGGVDRFVFEPNWGRDELKGFDPDVDRLIFTDPALDSIDDFLIRADGKDTLIVFGDDTLLLKKVSIDDVTEDIFRFDLDQDVGV